MTLKQNSEQHGIFSKLIEEQQEEDQFVKEIEDAKLRKKQQLAEAEQEHEKLVAQEEKEEAEKREKDEAARLEKEEEDRKDNARKNHEKLLKELTDESNAQIKTQGVRFI